MQCKLIRQVGLRGCEGKERGGGGGRERGGGGGVTQRENQSDFLYVCVVKYLRETDRQTEREN